MKSMSYTKQPNLFLHFLSTSKRSSHACSCNVWQQWRTVYVLLHNCVNVRVCNLHSLHHTGSIESYKLHTVHLGSVALLLSHSVLVQFFGWQTQAGWWCLLLGSDPRVVCLEQLKDRSLEIADTSSTHLWYCLDGKPRVTFTLIFLGVCPFPYDRHHPTTRLAENLHWLLWMIQRNCHCSVSCHVQSVAEISILGHVIVSVEQYRTFCSLSGSFSACKTAEELVFLDCFGVGEL